MINLENLRDYIVAPTLKELGMYAKWAERLVIGTALAESVIDGDMHIKQQNGPALGIYQMEPATHEDIYKNFLLYDATISKRLAKITPEFRNADRMVYDLRYATAMCRIHYWRNSFSIPDENDILAIGSVWKDVYNTRTGKGTVEGFINKAQRILKL